MGDLPVGIVCGIPIILKIEDMWLFLPLSKIEEEAKSFFISVELSLGFWSIVFLQWEDQYITDFYSKAQESFLTFSQEWIFYRVFYVSNPLLLPLLPTTSSLLIVLWQGLQNIETFKNIIYNHT